MDNQPNATATPIRHALAQGISGLTGLLLAFGILVPPAVPAAESATVRLQKGIFAEETEGDLDAAIRWYREVLSEETTLRPLAAEAQYRYGECLRKKGQRDEAHAAFHTLLERYPGEPDLVARARRQLADLGATPAGIRVSKVLIQGRPAYEGVHEARLGSVSPDGRYFSFTDWRSTNGCSWLRVRDLTTGRVMDPTAPLPWGVFGSVWSPDGLWLAHVRMDSKPSIRISHPDGSEPRVLLALDEGARHPRLMDWSPDGRFLLARIASNLVEVAVADGSQRVVRALGRLQPDDFLQPTARYSPNGRQIAYDHAPDEGQPFQRDLFLLDLATGKDEALVAHPAHDYGPVWTPDGRALVFASDRTGGNGLWMVPLSESGTSAEPHLVTQVSGRVHPKDFTRDGTFLYDVMLGDNDLYLADMSSRSGNNPWVGNPRRLNVPFEGWNNFPLWSPEGTRIAFVSRRQFTRRDLDLHSNPVLCVHSTLTQETREIPNPPRLTLGYNPRLQWHPDGRALAGLASLPGDTMDMIYRVDIESGAVSRLVETEGPIDQWLGAVWSKDGGRMVYGYRMGATNYFMVRSTGETRDRELWRGSGRIYPFGFSPDGNHLTLRHVANPERRVETFLSTSLSGARTTELFRFAEGQVIWGNIEWTPDGSHLLFARARQGMGPALCRLPASGGRFEESNLTFAAAHGSYSLSPDGRTLVFTGPGRQSELWAVNGLAAASCRLGADSKAETTEPSP